MKNYLDTKACSCGKKHDVAIDDVLIGKGVIQRLPEFLHKYHCQKAFILADKNTYKAAGETVLSVLRENGFAYSMCVFQQDMLEPNEESIGSAVMHFDTECDVVIGVGSGVINDIAKIVSNVSRSKYIIVGTAPSMDGYASATSSVAMNGLKVSLSSRCADVIIGDTDILKQAPDRLLKAGLGDMLAKYVSITEWRISHLVTGEYYCERVAELIRTALKKCVDNAEGLLKREDAAIEAVFEGLVIGGIAMAYAGLSRPASGVEHYFSHVWDMRGLEFGTQVDLHGIQCAVATMKAIELYETVKTVIPDKEKATSYVDAFDYAAWCEQLRAFLGNSSETMIAQEQKERKYDTATHLARFQRIADNWDAILKILEEELPSVEMLRNVMDTIGIPCDLAVIGVDRDCAELTFKATKDIRDKYVLSRLAWDLGILDDLCKQL